MNLAISNIAWDAKDDEYVYGWMNELGFKGLEIAPTRIISEKPYDHLNSIIEWKNNLREKYGISVVSMQSIWYGRNELIFGTEAERNSLLEYTEKAILFAEAADCPNIVFGCPRNRNIPEKGSSLHAYDFFRLIGDCASQHNTVIALEPNPPIYNTNFLNTTEETIEFIRDVGSDGLALNLDAGTMIENGEGINILKGNEKYIHHVHISEPGLGKIFNRKLHKELADFLKETDYKGYVSIEVKKQDNLNDLLRMMEYVKSVLCTQYQ